VPPVAPYGAVSPSRRLHGRLCCLVVVVPDVRQDPAQDGKETRQQIDQVQPMSWFHGGTSFVVMGSSDVAQHAGVNWGCGKVSERREDAGASVTYGLRSRLSEGVEG
jgi:hypothetical protein